MKMYVVVRKDLSSSQMAVQAGHALAEFLLRGHFTRWNNGTLIYLVVKNLDQLERLKYNLENNGILFSEFKEPDLDNETTAIATDQNCSFLKKLNLL